MQRRGTGVRSSCFVTLSHHEARSAGDLSSVAAALTACPKFPLNPPPAPGLPPPAVDITRHTRPLPLPAIFAGSATEKHRSVVDTRHFHRLWADSLKRSHWRLQVRV